MQKKHKFNVFYTKTVDAIDVETITRYTTTLWKREINFDLLHQMSKKKEIFILNKPQIHFRNERYYFYFSNAILTTKLT